MNKTISKVVSLILCIAMILSANFLGLQTAFAEEDDQTNQVGTAEPDSTDTDVEEAETADTPDYQAVSLESLLDENGYLTDEGLLSLQYLPYDVEKYTEIKDNGDGTSTLNLYAEPIKYKTEEGDYEYIDNTLAQTTISGSAENIYSNVASDIDIQISDNLNQEKAIELSYEDYNIAFKPLNLLTASSESIAGMNFIEADTGVVEESIKDIEECEAVAYTDTFNQDADIVITPTTSGLKEDIVLYKIPTETEFSYQLTVENVVPLLRSDGNVYFVDLEKGLIVAVIAAPYMYDSSTVGEMNMSEDISVQLEKVDDITYEYVLIPDRTFLENAVYPVTIDPSVKNTRENDIYDTYISSGYSGTNRCENEDIQVGRTVSGSKLRGLILLNSTGLNYIKSQTLGCAINKVEYCAYQTYSGDSTPSIGVHVVSEPWTYNTVTWDNQPDFNTTAYCSKTVQAIDWYRWDITSLAMGWYNGGTNNGILLKIANESLNQYKQFDSDESTYKDYFSFTYTDTVAPPQPAQFYVSGSSFSGPTGTITLAWSAVTDLPTGGAVGVQKYRLAMRKGDDQWSYLDKSNSSLSHPYTGCMDNSSYDFAICVYDNNGNVNAWKYIYDYITPDKTGPTSPTTFNVNPSSWTRDNPTITWSGISDYYEGNHLQKAQYAIDNVNGPWNDIPTGYGTDHGTYIITDPMVDGQHTIYLRGMDSSSNPGAYVSMKYYKDSTAPGVSLNVIPNGNLKGIAIIKATITNSAGSNFDRWTLDFGYGNPAPSMGGSDAPPSITGYTTLNNEVICELDTPLLHQNEHLTILLTAYDASGNSAYAQDIRFISQSSTQIDAGLQIDSPIFAPAGNETDGYQPDVDNSDQYVINSMNIDVEYQKSGDGGITGLSDGHLYANNIIADETDATIDSDNGCLISGFNAAAYENGWLYPEGSVVFLYAQANDETQGDIYSSSTQQELEITDTFDDVSRIDLLEAENNVEQSDGVMQLVNSSLSGHFESKVMSFAGDVSYIDLIVYQEGSVGYEISVDGGSNWNEILPVSTDGGATNNSANRKYFTTSVGSSVKLRARLIPGASAPIVRSWSLDVRYTTYVNAVLVDNTFPENARGITELDHTTHDYVNGCIQLDTYSTSSNTHYSSGMVLSTERITSNGLTKVSLVVDETLEEGTEIKYYISTEGGAEGTWHLITPSALGQPNNWIDWTHSGTGVVLKAELTTTNPSNTPKLNSWRLCIQVKNAGNAYIVKLVDEPWNLSTMTGANYMTLLRWERSENDDLALIDDVTYNVYRSTTPYFVPSSETLAAEGLTENSWNDYNLNYRDTFYYKVTAEKMINGHVRESLPSNEDLATVVSENEVQKRLGLQNYWTYSGFGTGSGTGYVNVSNGDMVYSTTDIIVSDPFLAAVMRRTFNSIANTKTAMGYGWDFSFNTCLLREYSGGDEVGMILKDGDGSFHRFAKAGENIYSSAVGTYMDLTFDDKGTPLDKLDDEYLITRKDNIVYHFNAQSMKLKGFTDNNGNVLKFTYDSRGNLSVVENTVGDTITLTYHVEGAAPADPDYTYVNYHPDMLESVTWTENDADPVSVTYYYEYSESDRLTRAYTVIEDNTVYEETFIYNETNQLITISDPENKETDIDYDNLERVESITAANGDAYGYAYSDLGENQNRTTITNPYNVSIRYFYDDAGLLYQKQDALDNSIYYTHGANPANDMYLVTGMSYYNKVGDSTTSQLISYSYAYTDGNITRITAPDGTVTTYGAYNQFNKPSSVTISKGAESAKTSYGYNSHGNQTSVTDPEGKETTYTYSTVNGDPGYLTQVQGDFGNQTRYTYDARGRVTQIKEYDNGTYVRTATTYDYDYDADGCFMRVIATDAEGNSVTAYYDKLGRIIKKVYPDNADNSDDPNVYERWSYDLAGNLTWARTASGEEIRYEYDDLYRLTGTVYPDGSATSIEYLKWDSDGNAGTGDASGLDADRIVQTDGTDVKSISYYDVAGRLLKTGVLGGTSEIISARYEYDQIGNCTRVTDNAGRISEAQYNVIGQTTKTIADPSGENIQTTYTYDFLGNQASVKDGEGYTTTYSYDLDSRLESVRQTVGGSTLTTGYAYDIEEGGVIKNRVTDAAGHVSETWFDPIGRKLKDYNDGVTGDSAAIQTGYTYNDNYQVEIVTRNDGTREKYTYNTSGTVQRVDYYEKTESTENDSDDYILYAYNNSGQVTLESVYHGATEETTTYTYDGMGRVVLTTQGSLSSGGLSVNYAYDDAGRVIEISYAKGGTLRKLGYEYDTYGRIHYITLALGDSVADTVREYVYKTNGDIDHIKDFRNFEEEGADYIKTAYEINNAGMTTKITYTDYAGGTGEGVKKEEYTMAYDDRGYIVTETASTNYETAQTVNKSYIYDSIGRLAQATIGSETKNYTYDNVGNRLTMNNGTDSYAYSYDATGFNRLTGITKKGAFESNYTYDSRGNQTQEEQHYLDITIGEETTSYNQTTDYTYDLMNNMTGADVSTPEADAQGHVTYNDIISINAYNASGQRVSRVDGTWNDADQDEILDKGEIQNGRWVDADEDGIIDSEIDGAGFSQYYYTGSATLYTTNANNYLLTENILDPSGQIIASSRFDDQTPDVPDDFYFYHYDKRGSTTAIVQPDGSLITGYEYDEFGNLEQSGDEEFLNETTFTGSVTDTSTGLQYMNARYYNPETGRFISQDTYSGNPFDPWTQHLYSYCGNNPVNMIDPTGHLATLAQLYDRQSELQSQYDALISQAKKYEATSACLDIDRASAKRYAALAKISFTAARGVKLAIDSNQLIIDEAEKELEDLQYKLDNQDYQGIDQGDYENLGMNDSTLAESGCGMIATLIAISKLGNDVNATEAYSYFSDEDCWDIWGGIKYSSISDYACTYEVSADELCSGTFMEVESGSIYVVAFKWQGIRVGHFQAIEYNNNGSVTAYNSFSEYQSYQDFWDSDGRGMMFNIIRFTDSDSQ